VRQLESRVVASDDDGGEFSELIRERTAKLPGPDDELLTRGPPSTWDPEIKAMWEKILAAAMAARGNAEAQRTSDPSSSRAGRLRSFNVNNQKQLRTVPLRRPVPPLRSLSRATVS